MFNTLSFLDGNGRFVVDEQRIRDTKVPNIGLARKLGLEFRKRLKLPSVRLIAKVSGGRLVILIDCQNDFGDDGRLAVPGAFGDIGRLLLRLWRGFIEEPKVGFTDWIDTNDFHPAHVIHGDSWWEDPNGDFPDVEQMVAMEMELENPNDEYPFIGKYGFKPTGIRYRPRVEKQWTIEQYAPHLKATGQGNIWVFKSHCKMGTDGVALIPALAELREFVSVARDLQPTSMFKGQIPKVDWFGPFCPCMEVPDHPQGGVQKVYLDRVRANAVTEIAGEADDFCVAAGEAQVRAYYKDKRAVLERIRFLTDCTSAIFPDDPAAGKTSNADRRKAMQAAGVRVIKHDEPFTA